VYTDHIISCETCKVKMNKRFAPPAVIFKGTGFYKTGG
jgi:predicted nucleic acid-binding Zn ribbon protein